MFMVIFTILLSLSGCSGINESNIGQVVRFGHYTVEENSDGNDPLEWIILDYDHGKVLLLSRYSVDMKCFIEHPENGSENWEGSSLRKWLNEDFYNSAFTDSEKKNIVLSYVKNEDVEGTDRYLQQTVAEAGNDTKDYLFLLTADEADKYLKEEKIRVGELTPKAKADYGYIDGDLDDEYEGENWWLRSPSTSSGGRFHKMDCYGKEIGSGGEYETEKAGVRPAMWVKSGDYECYDFKTTEKKSVYIPEGLSYNMRETLTSMKAE